MSHKDLCINWIERHKFRRDDGAWQECDGSGDPVGEPYVTEDELDRELWKKVTHLSIADL